MHKLKRRSRTTHLKCHQDAFYEIPYACTYLLREYVVDHWMLAVSRRLSVPLCVP